MSKAFVRESDEEEDRPEEPDALPVGFKNYMTPQGYRQLQEELRTLLRVERPKVVDVVSWAAGNGDRSENGDYIYGKRRLREIDRRIRFLSSADTRAELTVRRIAHALGYRFRTHRRDLPGTPDLVFPSRRLALFVNGCFWHRHEGCGRAAMPKTRTAFWEDKFRKTLQRDRCVNAALADLGWRAAVIWECETHDRGRVEWLLRCYLEGTL